MILAVTLSFLFIVCAILFLVLEFSVTVVGHLKGAPFVRSEKRKILTMLGLADIKPGEIVVDLGSGDGSLVIGATRLGAQGIGVEINPFLVWWSRFLIKRASLSDKATIIQADFRDYPLNQADVVLLYLWPSTIKHLEEKLLRELKPRARVISNSFKIPDWKHIQEKDQIFLYKPKG